MRRMAAEADRELELQLRADRIADRAVEEEGPGLAAAFESGNVAEIEKSFYRVFRRIYLEGVSDGREERVSKG